MHVFSLDPTTIENGRGRCPHEPNRAFASTFVGGDLYTGLTADFLGRDSVIFRTMGHRSSLRTEMDQRLLNAPKFVAAYLIPDNDDWENDKVYFFFTEKAVESDSKGHAIFSRVGRICVVRSRVHFCGGLCVERDVEILLTASCTALEDSVALALVALSIVLLNISTKEAC
ncbi:UNVERIFIED_CONTAM: Semaphorin-3G [Gekko kuhli]